MPILLNDLDLADKVEGQRSTLIVPCYMCPAVTVAVRTDKPFLQLFRSFLKSPPFEQYLKSLQSRLGAQGVKATVFKSPFVHHWFLCLWPSGRRNKLKRMINDYDCAIVLGCDSATETVRELVEATDCKVIQGMQVVGFMNAKMKFSFPCNVSFEDCRIVPLSDQERKG